MPSIPSIRNLDTQTILTAVSVIALLVNLSLVLVTRGQAIISRHMLHEARRDREVAYAPYLVYTRASDLPQPSGLPLPAYTLTNIGSGPALETRLFLFDPRRMVWRIAGNMNLAPKSSGDAPALQIDHAAVEELQRKELIGLGGWQDWEKKNAEIALLVCMDQFGRMLRFGSTHSPPECWVPGRWPGWLPGRSARWEPWTN